MDEQNITTMSDGTVNIAEASKGIVFRPTLYLRWSKDGTLQQAWQDAFSGVLDWRDIPTEGRTSQSIFDIPEHKRQLRNHPDTLRGKEEAVIEAAIARHDAQSDFWDTAYRGLTPSTELHQRDCDLREAVSALIAARESR